jgi:hypothetical protein
MIKELRQRYSRIANHQKLRPIFEKKVYLLYRLLVWVVEADFWEQKSAADFCNTFLLIAFAGV